MRRFMTLMAALPLVLAACGGGDSGDDSGTDTGTDGATAGAESSGGDGDSSSGEVLDPQPPGQATVSVDGQEFVFDFPGPSPCEIEGDRISFAFAIEGTGSNIGAGINRTDDGWQGGILVRIIDEDGLPVLYDLQTEAGLMILGDIAVDGDSMSFSGPIEMQPPNDGSNPPPVDVGDGTISASC